MRTLPALLLAACAALSACQLLDPPQTPQEAVGACYASVEGLATGASENLATARITPEQGAEVSALLRNVYAVCETADQALAGGRPADALGYLDAAAVLLGKLEDVLEQRALE